MISVKQRLRIHPLSLLLIVALGPGCTSPDPSERFGLTLEQRKFIYEMYVSAEDHIINEAKRWSPDDNDSLRKAQQVQLHRDGHHNDLATHYGLTREELEEIVLEGDTSHWPK